MASTATGVGRRKKEPSNDDRTWTLFSFFKKAEEKMSANRVVQHIVESLINTSVDMVELNRSSISKPRKHTGATVSNKTVDSWKKQYPWLIVEGEGEYRRLKCKTCLDGKINSLWAMEGSMNVQKNSVDRHGSSIEHQKAERKQCVPVIDIDEQLEYDMPISCDEDDIKLFRTVFMAVKEELSSEKVNSLLKLQNVNGASIKYKNLSWDTITEIHNCLKDCIQRSVVEDIVKSDFFAIMIDESTDLAVQKHLSICVRFVKKGKAVTKFLANLKIPDGKAHTIVNYLTDCLNSLGLDKTKIVSMATDGAAVMTGRKTGVGVQIKSKTSPFATMTHCIAHRLNLAVTDSIKNIDSLKKMKEMFNSLYIFMSGSSARTEKLAAVQNLLNEPILAIKEPHSIRWLGLRSAISAVFESYESVLSTLSYFAAERNAVASGLFKYFLEHKTVLLVGLLLDIHDVIAMLSCQLQSNNLMFSEIQPLMDGTISKLEYIKETDGESLQKVKKHITVNDNVAIYKGEILRKYASRNEGEFKTLREKYITALKKNIQKRFSNEDSDIFRDMSILLEQSTTNSVSEQETMESIQCVAQFYGTSKEIKLIVGNLVEGDRQEVKVVDSLIDGRKLEQEWPVLRGMVSGAYKNLSTEMLCFRVITIHNELLPEFCKLCKIALCYCVASVECERSFSLQNRLKNKYRCSLKAESIDTLITIHMCESDLESFDFTKPVKLWLAKKRRRKARLIQEYKPRTKGCPVSQSPSQ